MKTISLLLIFASASASQTTININGIPAQVVTGIPNTALPQAGLGAEYRMDTGSGTLLVDSSLHGFNAAFSSGSHAPTWNSQGLVFSRVNATYITLSTDESANGMTFQFSVDCRNNLRNSAFEQGWQSLIGNSVSTNSGISLFCSDLSQAGTGNNGVRANNRLVIIDGSAVRTVTADTPNTSIAVITFVVGSPNKVYINGVPVGTYALNGNSAGVARAGNMQLGGSVYPISCCTEPTNFTYFDGTMYGHAYWTLGLTDTQVFQAYQYEVNRLTSNGIIVNNPNIGTVSNLLCIGDSITAALQGSAVTPPCSILSLGDAFSITNMGIGGDRAMWTKAEVAQTASLYSPLAKRNVALYWAGTNDINFGNSPAQTLSDISASCRRLRALGYQVVVSTMISRTGQDAGKNALNSLIRASWQSFSDEIADIGGDPLLGCDGCYTNTTYFLDGVHPTTAGDTIAAAIQSAAINRLSVTTQPRLSPITVNVNTTALISDNFTRCNPSSSGLTYTLPDATTVPGKIITVKNIQQGGSNTCSVVGTGSQTIDGAASFIVANLAAFQVASNGQNWDIVSSTASGVSTTKYSYYRPITISHTKVGASSASNFPVLVSGTYSSLATVANGGRVTSASGYDIIFGLNVGCTSRLSHEIENYTAASGAVNMWVQVPSISNTSDTTIYMCYGNPTISSSQEQKSALWSAYGGVWHFSNPASLVLTDSSPSSATGTSSGGATATTGQIGGGASLDGATGTFLSFTPTTGWPSGGAARTLSGWMKSGGSQPNAGDSFPFGLQNSTLASHQLFTLDYSQGSSQIRVNYGSGQSSAPMPIDTSWHYIAVSFPGGSTDAGTSFYIDGSAATTTNDGSSVNTGAPASTQFGQYPFSSGYGFFGLIDEVRISSTARGPDWITAEFNNQSSPSTFYAVGSETAVP